MAETEGGFGRGVQSDIFRSGAVGSKPVVPAVWSDLVERAQAAMSKEAWAYVAGSAGRESTASENQAAFAKHRILPRMLRDVSQRDLSIELFGTKLPTPLLAAPIGAIELVQQDGDAAIARAATRLGVPVIMSNQASTSMEDLAAAVPESRRWFQLYWSTSDELVESLVQRAEASAAEAIVVTVDTQLLGWRPHDIDLAHLPFVRGMGLAQYTSDPVFRALVTERMAAMGPQVERPHVTPTAVRTMSELSRRYPGSPLANLISGEPRVAVETFLDVFSRSSLSWDDLPFLRSRTKLPIILKGIQHPDDARHAVEAGVDAVMVSTHAGRQIDGAAAALDSLPGVVAAVHGAMPVLFDSGVRSGADLLIALALGATAVAVGRPWVYGMAVAGEDGAHEVLRNILAEFDISLGLSGHRSPGELTPDSLS